MKNFFISVAMMLLATGTIQAQENKDKIFEKILPSQELPKGLKTVAISTAIAKDDFSEIEKKPLTWPYYVVLRTYAAIDGVCTYDGEKKKYTNECSGDDASYALIQGFTGVRYNKIFRQTFLQYFGNKTNRDALINWLKPVAVEAFKLTPKEGKKIYLEMLKDVSSYLNNYNEKAELAYLKKDNAIPKKDERNFLYYSADNKKDPYRPVKAFLLRRMLPAPYGDRTLTIESAKELVSQIQVIFDDDER